MRSVTKDFLKLQQRVGVPDGGENYLTSSEDQVRMIAKALGKEDEGEMLLKEVETGI